ncbi:hypothetical protein BDN72DRAFT_866247, partial [Pluteus cervinus]
MAWGYDDSAPWSSRITMKAALKIQNCQHLAVSRYEPKSRAYIGRGRCPGNISSGFFAVILVQIFPPFVTAIQPILASTHHHRSSIINRCFLRSPSSFDDLITRTFLDVIRPPHRFRVQGVRPTHSPRTRSLLIYPTITCLRPFSTICVLTVFACVYTALHPNIPDPEAKLWKKISPEAVIWWAMRQWYGARSIARDVNYWKPELKWTMTHGHFVQMGGLEAIHPDGRREVLDPADLCSNWKINYLDRGSIDLDELQFPKKQVQDRSKGDFLSKGLVALQTSWFVLECIARFQQHLPITELEIVTLAFAVLNIITYGFWWDKPLNVNCQVQIHIKPDVSPDEPEANESQEGDGNEVEGEGRQVREA